MKCQIPQISWHGRDPVLSVDFQFADGEIRRLATGGTDAHVFIWYVTLCANNTIKIDCACELVRHNKSVNVVRFSPNGEFLASGDDEGGIFIWKLKENNIPDLDSEESEGNKENWMPFKLLRRHLDDICDLNWSPNSDYLISGSIDNCVIIWDVAKGQCNFSSKDAKGFVQGVAWDPLNKHFASMSSDRILRIYNVLNNKVAHRVSKASADTLEKTANKPIRLFHDDTLQSFCRRLAFSPDGELLFVPSGIKEKEEKVSHTTYAFSRYDFSQPVFNFPTGQKYTVAVRCCPLRFKLRECKNSQQSTVLIDLPYRVLIAVATQDSIFLYDTQQQMPFAYVSNIHYAHLTDMTWSHDARMLIASSTDGYCSFIIFHEGELGEVYIEELKPVPVTPVSSIENSPTVNVSSKATQKKTRSPYTENVSTTNNSDGVKSPRKSLTPKKLYISMEKKTSTPIHKRCSKSIESFFSPPSKKARPAEHDSEDDCLIIGILPKDEEETIKESKIIGTTVMSGSTGEKEFSVQKKYISVAVAEKNTSLGVIKDKNKCGDIEKNKSGNSTETKCNKDDISLLDGTVSIEKLQNACVSQPASEQSFKENSRKSNVSTVVLSNISSKPVDNNQSKAVIDSISVEQNVASIKKSEISSLEVPSEINFICTEKLETPAKSDSQNQPKRRIQFITLSDEPVDNNQSKTAADNSTVEQNIANIEKSKISSLEVPSEINFISTEKLETPAKSDSQNQPKRRIQFITLSDEPVDNNQSKTAVDNSTVEQNVASMDKSVKSSLKMPSEAKLTSAEKLETPVKSDSQNEPKRRIQFITLTDKVSE